MQVRDTPVLVDPDTHPSWLIVGAGGSGILYGPSSTNLPNTSGPGTTVALSGPTWVLSQGGRDGTAADVVLVDQPPSPVSAAGSDTVKTVAAAGAAYTVDLAQGTVHDLTLTAALALTLPAASAGKSFSLVLRQDATGSRVVTWPACKWPGAATPTLTTTPNGVDLVSFLCVNGTDWIGFPSGYDLR